MRGVCAASGAPARQCAPRRCATATTIEPTARPSIADAAVLTSHPATHAVDGHLHVMDQVVGRVQAEFVGADQQDVPADPQHRHHAHPGQGAPSTIGMALTRPRPKEAADRLAGLLGPASQAGVVHLDDEHRQRRRPQRRDREHGHDQDESPWRANPSPATSLRAITMISADRMKSVRVAAGRAAPRPAPRPPSPPPGVVPAEHLPQLLRALVAEVRAADHQDGVSSYGGNSLSSSAAGRMKSSLLRSEPMAIRLMIGSSRSGLRPCT